MKELVELLAHESLRHLIPSDWDRLVQGLGEKGAHLFRIRPEIDGPVKFEGLLCSAKPKGSGLKYEVTPVLSHSHDMAARTPRGEGIRRKVGGFYLSECFYPSLTRPSLISQVTSESAESTEGTPKAFFLPEALLEEYFSGRGLDLRELEKRQEQLKSLKRAVEI